MTADPDPTRHLDVPLWAWAVFAIVVSVSLAVDLVIHRGSHGGGRRQAVLWSIAWVGVSLLFAAFIGFELGGRVAQQFITAWLVEKSLSVDNLFVFLVIFGRLKIPRTEQHRVLFWGILGAFATRALFIAAGAILLSRWRFATYVLGAFLVFTGLKTLRSHADDEGGKESRILGFLKRHLPFTSELRDGHFITHEAGRRVATPLLLALVAIEITDILFAVDSIPAVFAISSDPFIVFSSNVFAILGLRALYLVLADVVADLEYLHYGLGALLMFIGVKMLASHVVELPHWASLAVTVGILTAAIVPSLVARRRRDRRDAPT
ncbi:MAG TPA: TerC family protein [Labilithrix sp.]|nr:TerC family protein [Labilithrix sp.]